MNSVPLLSCLCSSIIVLCLQALCTLHVSQLHGMDFCFDTMWLSQSVALGVGNRSAVRTPVIQHFAEAERATLAFGRCLPRPAWRPL